MKNSKIMVFFNCILCVSLSVMTNYFSFQFLQSYRNIYKKNGKFLFDNIYYDNVTENVHYLFHS